MLFYYVHMYILFHSELLVCCCFFLVIMEYPWLAPDWLTAFKALLTGHTHDYYLFLLIIKYIQWNLLTNLPLRVEFVILNVTG